MWILIDIDNFFDNDDIMTSLLKKLSISIKIGVIKRYGVSLVSFQIVDRIRQQSSWASCDCVHTAVATKQFRRRRCVLGISMLKKYTHTRITLGTVKCQPKFNLVVVEGVLSCTPFGRLFVSLTYPGWWSPLYASLTRPLQYVIASRK